MSSSESIQSKITSDIIKTWLFNSPTHGIGRIVRAKTLTVSLFWTYVFWIFTILMSAFISTAILKYAANPTKVHLSLRQYQDRSHYPAITFCNINPLQDDGFLNDIRKNRLPVGRIPSHVAESEYRKAVTAYVNRILAAQVNGETHPLVKWGFKLNDLLITCIFNKLLCNRNLTQFFHPNYGNCYTFDNNIHVQSKQADNIRHDWSLDGDDDYKLYLELFLHQYEYNPYLENRAAFRIFIHRKHEVPILSENSLFLAPNKYTKLKFSQRIMSFSRKCRDELTDEMKKIFIKRQVRYTQALCYKLCEQRFIEEQCRCIEPTLAIFYQFFTINHNQTKNNISLCSIDDKCLISRVNFCKFQHVNEKFDFYSLFEDPKRLCQQCLPECEIIQYSVQPSYANFPNTQAHDKVLQRVDNHFYMGLGADSNFDKVKPPKVSYRGNLRDNIVAVEISASSHATEILTESPMYTWVDLISSIGGQTGLWIGISLISLVEVIELLYLLIRRFYSYCLFYIGKKENKQ